MMLQRKGLLSVVGAILVLAIFSMAFPALGMAQSQNAVRVKIEKIDGPDEAEFGDVLLIDDADDVILYGLNKSVPQQSQVTLSFGSESIERNASFPGKFPIRDEQPIRIPKTESDVSIVANYFEDEIIQSVTGNISLDFSGDSVRWDLPHKIVQIVEEPPTANPRTGYVLLTQRL
ncbi:hypothetical protein GF373_06215, partial [bacterium]|nr:hypothetical protein [bacterium]